MLSFRVTFLLGALNRTPYASSVSFMRAGRFVSPQRDPSTGRFARNRSGDEATADGLLRFYSTRRT